MSEPMCGNCGKEPAKQKSDGTYYRMCEACQEYYRKHKRDQTGYVARGERTHDVAVKERIAAGIEREPETVRVCKQCGLSLPIEDFPKNGAYRKTVCKQCYSSAVSSGKRRSKPVATAPSEKLVLIDKRRGRAVMCRIETITDLPEGVSVGSLARELLHKGYRVMVAEDKANAESAGD